MTRQLNLRHQLSRWMPAIFKSKRQPTIIKPELYIETNASAEELEARLRELEPWRVNVEFSNGFSTTSLKTMNPFNYYPLKKLNDIMAVVGKDIFINKRVLDIGFNAGYNCIILSRDFGCTVTGIDNLKLNLQKAQLLSELANLDIDFRIADANSFCMPGKFDLILHLGTLYHLPDIFKALKVTATNLKPGGNLLLETVTYNNKDKYACRYVYGFNNDHSNYWALSDFVIKDLLAQYSFSEVTLIREMELKIYKDTGMTRSIYHAVK